MKIRREHSGEQDAIRALTLAAYSQPAEATLVDALRARGDSTLSLVAEDQGAIVGHALFSKLAAPAQALGLGPISVLPAHQRRGIGGALIREGLEQTKQQGWQAVFVLGDPAYYTRFGFSVEAAAKFETPYPKEYMMALALTSGALDAMSGAIAYAAPFSMFE